MMDSLITVIIPVFNAEQYVEKAILSVVNQNYVDEIIIVDDKSKDRSTEIVNELAKQFSQIKLITHNFSTNVGAGKIRNIGIVAAKNELLAFLDVDDFYYPDRFKNSILVLKNNPDADGVYEAVENIFESDEAFQSFVETRPDKYKFGELREYLNLFTLDKVVPPKDLFKTLMSGDSGFFHFNGLLVKKSLFDQIGLLNEDLELTQDTDIFFKMSAIGNLYPGKLQSGVASRLVHSNNRIYQDDDKLKYFATLKFFGLKSWAKERRLKREILQIIDDKNIKHCAESILKLNIYKFYRIKYFFLKLIHRWVISNYLKRAAKKF